MLDTTYGEMSESKIDQEVKRLSFSSTPADTKKHAALVRTRTKHMVKNLPSVREIKRRYQRARRRWYRFQ